jgi:hypothetical protein
MSEKISAKHKENALIKVIAKRISEEKAKRAFGSVQFNDLYICGTVVRSELYKKEGNVRMTTRVWCKYVH